VFDGRVFSLASLGCPGGHKAGVIDCLGEKLALSFPGIYTPNLE
jgi:hypothetical protein